MDTDSESSDFVPPTRNNKSLPTKPVVDMNKEQVTSPVHETIENLPLSDNEKENLPPLLVQGVESEEEDKECYEELNTRPSRRAAVKAQGRITHGQVNVSDGKESSSRRKRDSKMLVESESENEEEDNSFDGTDAEESSFEEIDSDDSSLRDEIPKKGKRRRDSTNSSKKTSNVKESKVKGDHTQKKNTKTKQSSRIVKSDTGSKSNIPVKSIRSGLSSNSQARMESSHSSRLLHVRPIRAGLSRKSPIPRLHSSFLHRS